MRIPKEALAILKAEGDKALQAERDAAERRAEASALFFLRNANAAVIRSERATAVAKAAAESLEAELRNKTAESLEEAARNAAGVAIGNAKRAGAAAMVAAVKAEESAAETTAEAKSAAAEAKSAAAEALRNANAAIASAESAVAKAAELQNELKRRYESLSAVLIDHRSIIKPHDVFIDKYGYLWEVTSKTGSFIYYRVRNRIGETRSMSVDTAISDGWAKIDPAKFALHTKALQDKKHAEQEAARKAEAELAAARKAEAELAAARKAEAELAAARKAEAMRRKEAEERKAVLKSKIIPGARFVDYKSRNNLEELRSRSLKTKSGPVLEKIFTVTDISGDLIEYRYRDSSGRLVTGSITLDEAARKSWRPLTEEEINAYENALDSNNIELLDWEVLPSGWWDDPMYLKNPLGKNGKGQPLSIDPERMKFVASLGKHKCYAGSSEFGPRRYYVFEFDFCVIAECPNEGNAVYVLKDVSDWQNWLNIPKRELIRKHKEMVKKIIHKGDWQSRLKDAMTG